PADIDQLLQGPAGPGRTVGAIIGTDGAGLGPALIERLDLAHGLAAGRAWIEDLVQKGEEGEFWGANAFSAIGLLGVGLQQRRVNPGGTKALQMVEGLAAQGLGGFFERGVEFAK